MADPTPWMGRAFSLSITLPPLAGVVFKPETPPATRPPASHPGAAGVGS